jgi:hypothetical protein
MTVPQPTARRGQQWAVVSAHAWRHPKFEQLLDMGRADAIGVWTMMLSWSADHWDDDGYISTRKAASIGMTVDIADALITVNLVEAVADNRGSGYQVHDWTDWNRSADDIADERQAVADRQAKSRERRRQQQDTKQAMTSGNTPVTGDSGKCHGHVTRDNSVSHGRQRVSDTDTDTEVEPLRVLTSVALDASTAPNQADAAALTGQPPATCQTCGLTTPEHWKQIALGRSAAHDLTTSPADPPPDPNQSASPQTNPENTTTTIPAVKPPKPSLTSPTPTQLEANRRRQLAALEQAIASSDPDTTNAPSEPANTPTSTSGESPTTATRDTAPQAKTPHAKPRRQTKHPTRSTRR